MKFGRRFILRPFAPDSAPAMAISAGIVCGEEFLQVEFGLSGALHGMVIPPSAEQPGRRHDLWKGTCFELFFAPSDTSSYYEFNLSPAGHWNLYGFDAYRHGMREEPALCATGSVLLTSEALAVHMEIDLGRLGLINRPLQVSPCVVLLAAENNSSFWAISHPGPQPDFHNRQSFFRLET